METHTTSLDVPVVHEVPETDTPATPSPVASIAASHTQNAQAPKKRGRPRKYDPTRPLTDAERQTIRRAKKKPWRFGSRSIPPQALDPDPEPPRGSTDKKEWRKYLKQVGLAMSSGAAMPDAERGRGRLVLSGNNNDLAVIDAEHNLDACGQFDEDIHSDDYFSPGQRRVTPQGHGPDD